MTSTHKPLIGYTTGVFDLFHIGHLNILEKSKSMCDYLIVGCTSDELVQHRKHKQPIIPINERISIVESIKYVDQVVEQNSMDKFAAYEKYKFDIMFVGDDWKGTVKWQELEDKFTCLGVKIVYFPYTTSTSSTKVNNILDSFFIDDKTPVVKPA
jgi:glycerol-3-phosphate cytidylyltransferase